MAKTASLVNAVIKKDSAKSRMDKLAKKEKDDSFVFLNIRIQKDLRRKVKVFCAEHDMTVQGFVLEAVSEKLAK